MSYHYQFMLMQLYLYLQECMVMIVLELELDEYNLKIYKKVVKPNIKVTMKMMLFVSHYFIQRILSCPFFNQQSINLL
jgi:hypothetical protein